MSNLVLIYERKKKCLREIEQQKRERERERESLRKERQLEKRKRAIEKEGDSMREERRESLPKMVSDERLRGA